MYSYDEDGLGLAIAPVVGAISGLFGGTRVTGAAVYREDGARWSAAKQYWEKPSGTRAAVQSPKPSGCPQGVACVQSMSGGPVVVGGSPVVTPKGTTASQAQAAAKSAAATGSTGGINALGISPVDLPDPRQALGAISGGLPLILAGVVVAVALSSRRR